MDNARAPLTRAHVFVLVLIVALGLGVRLAVLADARSSPGYTWEDPDGYMAKGILLANPEGWRWTFEAAVYTINGQRHALPPLYSVFLSIFALWPGFPLSAQVAQVVLAAGSIALVFALGRRLHTIRAGLIAAAAYAVWVPNIFNVWSTSQETLYLPLLLTAFVLLGRAADRPGGRFGFLVAGTVFGMAALTRSMPLFFVGPLACAHVALSRNRRQAAGQAVALLLGFLAITGPYSVGLSRHLGRLAIIDTHGSIHVEPAAADSAPTPMETAQGLWRMIRQRPVEYLGGCAERARSLLHVNGGRILQIYVVAGSRTGALFWKVLVHLGADALLIVSVMLAGLGATVSRDTRLAVFLVLWTMLNIAIASVGGFGGARLRAPFEPCLIVLAGVVCAGAWRRASGAALGTAVLAGVVAAAAVLPQIPNTLRAWPDYAVAWPSIFHRSTGRFVGAAGLNVPAPGGVARLTLTLGEGTPIDLRVRVGGVHVRTLTVAPATPTTIHTAWPARGLAFVELDQIGPPGERQPIDIRVAGR